MTKLRMESLKQSDSVIEFSWTDTGSVCRITREERILYEGRETVFQDEQLRAGELYIYTIERLNDNGKPVERLKMQTGTEERGPQTENQLRQIVLTAIIAEGEVTLAWGDIQGIRAYEIFRNNELLDAVQESQFTDTAVDMETEYVYTIHAKRPLERSGEELFSSEKSLIASIFGKLNPNSTEQEASEESFWLTKRLGKLDTLLNMPEKPKGEIQYPVWNFRYKTFLSEKILANPNLISPNRFFEGDGRGFDPHSKRYRTLVEFTIRLDKEATIDNFKKDVGTSVAYNWRKKFRKAGVGSAENVGVTQEDENNRKATVAVTHSVSNPLTASPAIDYDVSATFYRNGHFDIVGVHDQAPNHEVYLNRSGQDEWLPLHRAESKGLAYMAGTIANQYWRYSNFE